MRALSLVVVLLAAAAQAQVAGLCGAGKVCTVRGLRATQSTGTNPTGISVTDNAFFCVRGEQPGAACSYGLGFNGGAFGLAVSGTAYAYVNSGTGRLYLRNPIVTVGALDASTFGVTSGLAFASFGTCSGTNAGTLLYDSTNNVWRYCDGATWQILATSGSSDENWAAYEPSTLATGVNFIGAFKPARTHTTARMRCVGRTAGSGTGNVTVSVYDQTAPATRCTLTVACASSGGTLASTACAITAGNDHVLTVNAASCSAAPFANAVCNVTFE